MKTWFAHQKIGNKIKIAIMATSSLLLFSILIVQIITQYRLLINNVEEDTQILADGLVKTCSAALVFNDREAAIEILSGAASKVNIVAVQLFDRDRKLFAEYTKATALNNPAKLKSTTSNLSIFLGVDLLKQLHPVMFEGERIGTLTIQRDLADVRNHLLQFSLYWTIVISLAWLVSVWLSHWFKKLLSSPIETLNQAMEAVSGQKDYSVRIKAGGTDELGQLTSGFNEMLEQIELRDDELTLHRDRLEHLAHHDALTGLPNRLLLDDRLKHAIQRSERISGEMSVMFLDLDRFKYINDTLGHDVGDVVLIEVAQRLEKVLRKADTVARLSGDEFVIILEDFRGPAKVTAIADKIIFSLAQPFIVSEHQISITVSIGVTFYPQDGQDLITLKRCADMAMYRAKEMGRNNYKIYEPEMGDEIKKHQQLDGDLREAIRLNQMEVYFQPQLSMKTGQLTGAEALVRWNHPTRGLVLPGQFISIAEESGIILKLGEWVLRETCRNARDWLDKGYSPLVFAVNVSPRQFHQGNLVRMVGDILNETRLPAHLLELEITESTLMVDIEESIAKMHKFREMGISLALDDFGSGYSSLSYIKLFPINKIKVDRQFVKDLHLGHKDKAIAASISSLARLMKIDALAEGVETMEQENALLALGFEFAQGFLYDRPLQHEKFQDLLKKVGTDSHNFKVGQERVETLPPAIRSSAPRYFNNPIIFAISTNRILLEQIYLVLNRMNFDVVPIYKVQDIESLAKAIKPMAILLDATMDGLNQVKTIRDNNELLGGPLILITNSIDGKSQQLGVELGSIETLCLPLRTSDLHKAMNRCDLLVGSPRDNIRVIYDVDVELLVSNQRSVVRAKTLSNEGIFVSGMTQLEVGSKLQVNLSVEEGNQMVLESQVLYPVRSNDLASSGTAIKFCNLSIIDKKRLKDKISDLLIGDIISDHELTFFES